MQLPRKMSAQNVMASISRTLGNREQKPTGNEIRFAGDERKDKLYEPKHKQKLVRVLTVVAYVIFVSMAAILLSLYYTFLWDPKDVSPKMRMPPECANIRLSNSITTSSTVNETQMERMTKKSVTVANEQSRFSEMITTQRQKDLLTTLIEIANTSSSVTPPPLASDNLQNDFPSDVDTKETSTRMDSNTD